jgi:hypothetical protein
MRITLRTRNQHYTNTFKTILVTFSRSDNCWLALTNTFKFLCFHNDQQGCTSCPISSFHSCSHWRVKLNEGQRLMRPTKHVPGHVKPHWWLNAVHDCQLFSNCADMSYVVKMAISDCTYVFPPCVHELQNPWGHGALSSTQWSFQNKSFFIQPLSLPNSEKPPMFPYHCKVATSGTVDLDRSIRAT